MKKLLLLLVIVGGYYVQGRVMFGNDAVQRWVTEFNSRSMAGEQSACDDFSDEAVVNIHAEEKNGTWEVEGGKDEACGYMKQASAAFTVLQASVQSEFNDFSVEPQDMFWHKVKVSYVQRSTMSAAHLPTMKSISRDTLILARGFTGIKVVSLTSSSEPN